jgi:hypothetical protein
MLAASAVREETVSRRLQARLSSPSRMIREIMPRRAGLRQRQVGRHLLCRSRASLLSKMPGLTIALGALLTSRTPSSCRLLHWTMPAHKFDQGIYNNAKTYATRICWKEQQLENNHVSAEKEHVCRGGGASPNKRHCHNHDQCWCWPRLPCFEAMSI